MLTHNAMLKNTGKVFWEELSDNMEENTGQINHAKINTGCKLNCLMELLHWALESAVSFSQKINFLGRW